MIKGLLQWKQTLLLSLGVAFFLISAMPHAAKSQRLFQSQCFNISVNAYGDSAHVYWDSLSFASTFFGHFKLVMNDSSSIVSDHFLPADTSFNLYQNSFGLKLPSTFGRRYFYVELYNAAGDFVCKSNEVNSEFTGTRSSRVLQDFSLNKANPNLLAKWTPTVDTSNFSGYVIYLDSIPGRSFYTDTLINFADSTYLILPSSPNFPVFASIAVLDTMGNLSPKSQERFESIFSIIKPSPNGLSYAIDSVNGLTLTWRPTPFMGFSKYVVQQSTGGSSLINRFEMRANRPDDTTIYIPGLNTGVPQMWTVRSMDFFRDFSEYSDTVQITLLDTIPPPVPELLSISGTTDGVDLIWKRVSNPANDFWRYHIYIDTVSPPQILVGTNFNINDTTFQFNGGSVGQRYYASVTSQDFDLNESALSTVLSAVSGDNTPPPPVGNITASIDSARTVINWFPNVNFDQDFAYYVIMAGNLSTSLQPIDTLFSIFQTTFIHQNLVNNRTYHYRILSFDTAGNFDPNTPQFFVHPSRIERELNQPFFRGNRLDSSLVARIADPLDVDFFTFELNQIADVTIGTSALGTLHPFTGTQVGNTTLTLLDSTGINQVAFNNNSPINPPYSQINQLLQPGRYYIRVTGNSSANVGFYRISISILQPDIYEPNNTQFTATALADTQLLNGLSIFPSGDVDFFEFNGQANYTAVADFNMPFYQGTIKIFDTLGAVLQQTVGNLSSFIVPYNGKFRMSYALNNFISPNYSLDFKLIPPISYADTIVINEIKYGQGRNQFIEFFNTSDNFIPVGKFQLNAPQFAFPDQFLFPPKSYIVVARDSAAFYRDYGFYPNFEWSGNTALALSQNVVLNDSLGGLVDVVFYRSLQNFPVVADTNFTMELTSPTANNNNGINWYQSHFRGGTPAHLNSIPQVYAPDGYGPVNGFTNAIFTPNTFSDTLSLSELFDSVDVVAIKLRAFDTLKVSLNYIDTNLLASVGIFNKQQQRLAGYNQFGATQYYQLIAPAEDTFYVVTRLFNDSLQFVLNEGFYQLNIEIGRIPILSPWRENFEQVPFEQVPAGWQVLNNDGNANQWEVSNLPIGLGNTNGVRLSGNAQGNDDWLITPPLTVSLDDRLKFFSRPSATTFPERLEVWLGSENATSANEFTILLDTFIVDSSHYKEYEIDLNPFIGGTYRIGFRNTSVNKNIHYIDEVSVSLPNFEAVVYGVVSDTAGQPLRNVEVSFALGSDVTDSLGRYFIDNVNYGTRTFTFERDSFSVANYNLLVGPGDTIALNATLRNNIIDTIYYNDFSAGSPRGLAYGTAQRWTRRNQLIHQFDTIIPAFGDTMLTFGNSLGYQAGQLGFWKFTGITGLNLSPYENIILSLDYSLEADTSDKLYLLGNEVFFIDINGDLQTDSNDHFLNTGKQWQRSEIDLSYLNDFSDLDLTLLFNSDSAVQSGFGAAIDQILIMGDRAPSTPAPFDLQGVNFVNNQVPISWKYTSSLQPDSFLIFRRLAGALNYQLIGATTDTAFTDTTIQNLEVYNYRVNARFPFGESRFSNEITINAGIPVVQFIPYLENFENNGTQFPPNWSFANSLFNPWSIGDSLVASTFNNAMVMDNAGAFINFFTISLLEVPFTSLLTSPWFDLSAANNRIVLSFDASGASQAEFHTLQLRVGLNQPWQAIDTLPSLNRRKQTFRFDLTDLVLGQPFVQFAFGFANDSNALAINNQGFAIDNIRFESVNTGQINGLALSETGNPLKHESIILTNQDGANWNTPKVFNLETDSSGRFSSDSLLIYQGLNYSLSVAPWRHLPKTVTNLNLNFANPVDTTITADLIIDPPRGLRAELDSLGQPKLIWNNPKLIGEISYDDGNFAFFDSISSSRQLFLRLTSDAPLPAVVNQIALYMGSNSPSAQLLISFFGTAANGLPNLLDTLHSSIQQITGSQPGWQFFNIGALLDTLPAFVSISVNSGFAQIGFSESSAFSPGLITTQNGVFSPLTDAILLRAYLSVAGSNFNYNSVQFAGTYNLNRIPAAGGAVTNLLTQSSLRQYLDTSILTNQSVKYWLTASSAFGTSSSSDTLNFTKTGIPFLRTQAYDTLSVLKFTDQFKNVFTPFSNIGEDTLAYQISYHIGFTPVHRPVMTDFTPVGLEAVSTYASRGLTLSDTVEVVLSLENINVQNEALNRVEFFFPAGMKLISSSDLVGIGYSRFLLSSGVTGDSVNLVFSDVTANSTGELDAMRFAACTLRIAVDSTYADSVYRISALYAGDKGNQSRGQVWLDQPRFNVLSSNQSGILPAGGNFFLSNAITTNGNLPKGARQPGFIRLATNAPQNGTVLLPFNIVQQPAYGSVRGIVTNAVNNTLIAGAAINVGYKSAIGGQNSVYRIDSLNVGTYQATANSPYFKTEAKSVTLEAHLDTVQLNFSLVPDVRLPVNLTADGALNGIQVQWEMEDFLLNYELEEPFLDAPIEDFKVVDADGDGNRWQYYGIGPFQGKSSVAVNTDNPTRNNDWLISKQIRVEEQNATLSFWAAPQDLLLNEEEFTVWVSNGTDTILDFTDSLFYFKFPLGNSNWQKFNVPIGQYVGDSIYVAIQCRSLNQFKLKIDLIEITSCQPITAAPDSGVYHFNLYRAINNGAFSLLQNIVSANDTVVYQDTTVGIDTLYTYYATSVIPAASLQSASSNFDSYRLLSSDAELTAISNPQTGRSLDTGEVVSIIIRNAGTDSISAIDSLKVGYHINGLLQSIETVSLNTALQPLNQLNYTFNKKANLKNKGSYQIDAWVQMTKDNNSANDTLIKTINHLPDTVEPPVWTVNPFQFQFSMSLTAEIFILDTLTTDTNDILAAFSGNQVRGVAKVQFVPNFNKYVALITVFSNLSIENITFKVWDASRDSIFPINETYTFINNQIYGSLINPEKLYTPSPNRNFNLTPQFIHTPKDGRSTYTANEQVKFRLANVGSSIIRQGEQANLGYLLFKNDILVDSHNENFTFTADFNPQDTLRITFAKNVNLLDTAVYKLEVYSSFAQDFDLTNDTIEEQIIHKTNTQNPQWSVNPNAFQFSAFITARVFVNEILSQDINDQVAAFTGNQVRGVANVQFVAPFSEWVIQMPLYSNTASGDQIRFMVYDASRDRTLHVFERYTFAANANFGNLVTPERLFADDDFTGVQESAKSQIQIYPNPAKDMVQINTPWSRFEVSIFDLSGRLINNLGVVDNQSYLEVADLSSGVYQLRLKPTEGASVTVLLQIVE